jgi:hypothetical protein
MRNIIDFSSWQGTLETLLGLALVSLIGVGIRLLVMQTVQLRRERANRQINERLKTLIAAYKTLGGSFTGNLTVDLSHLSELRSNELGHGPAEPASAGSDRRRRLRDAVEAALSDVMLLGGPPSRYASRFWRPTTWWPAGVLRLLRSSSRCGHSSAKCWISIRFRQTFRSPSRVPFGPPQGARGQYAASVPAARMEGAKETKAVLAQVHALWVCLMASGLLQAGRMLLLAPRCVASSLLFGRHPADEVLLAAGRWKGPCRNRRRFAPYRAHCPLTWLPTRTNC